MALYREKKSALLIIDMQNGVLDPSGTFGKLGLHIHEPGPVITNIQALRTLAQRKNMPVIFTRLAWKPDYSDAGLSIEKHRAIFDLGGFVADTWDSAVISELEPTDDEETLDKTRNSAFWATGLAERLRRDRVEQIIVSGVGTNVCVESTVRDAFSYDFHVVIVSDATATLSEEEHQASLKSMSWFGSVATLEEVKAGLSAVS